MDYVILGTIGWGSFVLFVAGAVVATLYLKRSYRRAIGVFMVATLGGYTFSFIGGFSIGRFFALLPLVVTAFAVTYSRSLWLQLAAYAAAIGSYLLLAWVFGEQTGAWGIQFMLPLSLAAYVAALIFPPTPNPARSP
jgi:hypothetical protein